MATRARDGRAVPRDDGMDRPRYVREHLGAVADAVAAGVPVRAYFHWSLMDNYEWGTYEPALRPLRDGPQRPGRGALHGHRRRRATTRAGEFARVVAGLRAGDRSVLGGPA